jgi:hypothetical protein
VPTDRGRANTRRFTFHAKICYARREIVLALTIHTPTDFHGHLIDFDGLLLLVLSKDSFLSG